MMAVRHTTDGCGVICCTKALLRYHDATANYNEIGMHYKSSMCVAASLARGRGRRVSPLYWRWSGGMATLSVQRHLQLQRVWQLGNWTLHVDVSVNFMATIKLYTVVWLAEDDIRTAVETAVTEGVRISGIYIAGEYSSGLKRIVRLSLVRLSEISVHMRGWVKIGTVRFTCR